MDPEITLHGSFYPEASPLSGQARGGRVFGKNGNFRAGSFSHCPQRHCPSEMLTDHLAKVLLASQRPSHPLLSSGASSDTKEPGLTLRSQRFQNLTVHLMG